MRVEFVTVQKTREGSGGGIGEYTLNLRKNISKNKKVSMSEVYAYESYRKYHSEIYLNFGFNREVSENYDVIKPDVVHLTDQNLGLVARTLKRQKKSAPVVTSIHDLELFKVIEGKLKFPLRFRIYSRLTARCVDAAVLESDFLIFDESRVQKAVEKRYGRIKNQKVISLGVNNVFLTELKHKENKTGKYRIGYLGALQPHKNVAFLVNATKHLNSDFEVFIYGSGIERERLKDLTIRENIKNVNFMGFAPEDKKREIYDSFDAFVYPVIQGGFGLPIVEAQARGLPVILYKHGDIPEEVRKYCFEAEDPEHAAQILIDLNKNGYNEKLKKKATAYARGFTWEKTATETLEIYKKVQ